MEQAVSAHLGRQWTIATVRDMADFACHPAAILSDGECAIFAKFSDAANGREQFEIELAGLHTLSERAGVRIPAPVGIAAAAGGWILVMEAVQAVERTPRHWREIGQTLARIHKVKGSRFGLETQGYFGQLPQDNRPMEDWPAFYAARRVLPVLRLAADSGKLPREFVPRVEKLLRHSPDLCGPVIAPALIHGDAQQNNFISAEDGPVVIDPAVYFGHPEMDLAYIDYFQPVPDDFFDGYREELPIDPGFWERRPLWRIWGYLAAVTVEGTGYLGRLDAALRSYE